MSVHRVECRCGCGAWWYYATRKPRGGGRPPEFLNADHYDAWRKAKRRKPRVPQACECCGVVFVPTHPPARFCSRRCKSIVYHRRAA